MNALDAIRHQVYEIHDLLAVDSAAREHLMTAAHEITLARDALAADGFDIEPAGHTE